MKIKFSKVVAIGCALCVAFAGLTAFAKASVTTTTTYGWGDDVATMEVDTKVSGVTPGVEVTYYVSDGTKIVYINQDTATEEGKVSFKFNASEADVLAATAKYGTDDTVDAEFPTFEFNEGTNFLTEVDAGAKKVGDAWGIEVSTGYPDAGYAGIKDKKAYAYKAMVYGNYKEYGIKVDGEKYPAAGCSDIDGIYMVILENIDITGKTVEPYAE